MFATELILTLLNIDNIGRGIINKLINKQLPISMKNEDLLFFLNKNKNISSKIGNINYEQIIKAKNKAKNIIKYCEENNINIINILDKDFPLKLKIITDNPVIIFYKGNFNCISDLKSIAIVGTRNPSLNGQKIAYDYSKIFANNGFTVISGLAKGCDEYGHKGSIDGNGKTLAVLPCGLDYIYPTCNSSLANKIISSGGCLISEYFPGQRPTNYHFIDRDRIQSALSLGVLVIECEVKSGTMHTVNFALKQNKLVGCYKNHNLDNINYSGNLSILQNKKCISIENSDSLDKFIYLLEDRFHEYSFKQNYINEQISF